MRKAAKELDFERAAELRDLIIELKGEPAYRPKGKDLPFKKSTGSRKRRGR